MRSIRKALPHTTRRQLFFAVSALGSSRSSTSAAGADERRPKLLSSLPPIEPGFRRLYLVRHGETDWNLDGRIQGTTDNPLNANGRAQAAALAEYLADEPLDAVYSSSLRRASETAAAVAARHPACKTGKDARFMEMCFGDYEGMLLDEFRAEYNGFLASWASGDTARAFPGKRGESPDAVAQRGLDGLRVLGLLDGGGGADPVLAADDRSVCIVAHGRFNKILIAALQGDVAKASDVQQGNTCINVLDVAPGGKCVVRLLDVREHLGLIGKAVLQ